jgi:4-hydroxy-tetrahydrodipicolinate synthase
VWCGADELNLALLATGARGIISVSAHLVGSQLAEMVEVAASDPARAAAIHIACLPLHRALFAEPSPAPLKAAMAALGLPGGPVRPPLVDASPEATAAVLAALDGVAATLDRPGVAPTGATA